MSVRSFEWNNDSGSEEGRSAWSSWSGGSDRVRRLKPQSSHHPSESKEPSEDRDTRPMVIDPDRRFVYEFDRDAFDSDHSSDDDWLSDFLSKHVFKDGRVIPIEDKKGRPAADEEHSKRSNDEAPDAPKGQSTLAPSGVEKEGESRSAARRPHPSELPSDIDPSIAGLPSEPASRTEGSSCHSSACATSSPEAANISPQPTAANETTMLSKSMVPSRDIACDHEIAGDEGDWLSKMSLYLPSSEGSDDHDSTVHDEAMRLDEGSSFV